MSVVSCGEDNVVLPVNHGPRRLDIATMRLVALPQSMSDNFAIPLPNGEYRVVVFDLETNTLPRLPISMAADSKNIIVTDGSEGIYT